MKYNLDNLHWQEFELLSFKVLQYLISTDVEFIEGGKDKGRDIIHNGNSNDYKKEWHGKWIFQVKHKSKDLSNQEVLSSLGNDLKRELEKVFLKHEHDVDNYVFITNKTINGNIYDSLNSIFELFVKENQIKCNNFSILSYRHFESCIDRNNSLKRIYPNIILQADFLDLIQEAIYHNFKVRKKGWIQKIQNQRNKFVLTQFYETASEKLRKYPAIILSGPPKSGKTFNAEILALNYSIYDGFEPILIDNPEEIESSYLEGRKQIFICDDAFGRYALSLRVEDWFKKLERIFYLANQDHLFIFTSREYVLRAFKNYGDDQSIEFLKKIIVESHNYSSTEKLSILKRYTLLSDIPEYDKSKILGYEKFITEHEKFSPETIRAYFSNIEKKEGDYLEKLLEHIEAPDAYLTKVFFNLNNVKQAVILSVLCTVHNDEESVLKSFNQICKDLEINNLIDSSIEFEELEDSILKILKADEIEEISFYHPSMQEFLIKKLIQNRTGKLSEVVLKNLNISLLELSLIKPQSKPLLKLPKNTIKIKSEDLDYVSVGLSRLAINSNISIYQVSSIFKWFALDHHTLDLKVNAKSEFDILKPVVHEIVQTIANSKFYNIHKKENSSSWSELFYSLKQSSFQYGVDIKSLNIEYLKELLLAKRNNNDYWLLVFRALAFTGDELTEKIVGKEWLNKFYFDLKRQIFDLGYELFEKDFPEFKLHYSKLKNKEHSEKRKHKPNKTWYPRFIDVKEKISILKENKGAIIVNKILSRLIQPYDEINQISDYAKNRHTFNLKKGWW